MTFISSVYNGQILRKQTDPQRFLKTWRLKVNIQGVPTLNRWEKRSHGKHDKAIKCSLAYIHAARRYWHLHHATHQ